MTSHATPIRDPLWWTDGTHVLPMTADEIAAWLARGVAYGWVVAAPSADVALARGERLANRGVMPYPVLRRAMQAWPPDALDVDVEVHLRHLETGEGEDPRQR
jgi:hypothetical protein